MNANKKDIFIVSGRASLGDVLGDSTIGGLFTSYCVHAGGCSIPKHQHSASYLCIVLSGGYTQHALKEFNCSRGALVTHPQGHVHSNLFGDAVTRCANVYVDTDWLDEPTLRRLLDDYRCIDLGNNNSAVARLERTLGERDAGSRLAIAGAVFDLISRAVQLKSSSIGQSRINKVRDLIAADPINVPTLASLGDIAGIHPAHLSRVFRKETGETPIGFARRLRIEQGDRLLRGESTIAQIAIQTGFYDQAHFARHFRRQFGMSPVQRRAQLSS